jgi:AAA-like domain/TIR domain
MTALNNTASPATRARIFLSYRRRAKTDHDLAHDLRNGLEKAGHSVFIDSNLVVGSDWAATIYAKIDWCTHFLVLLSPDAVASEMVIAEARRAYRRSKKEGSPALLPVWVGPAGDLGYELDSYIGRLQYQEHLSSSDLKLLLDNLLQAIETPAVPPNCRTAMARSRTMEPCRPMPSADPRMMREPGGTIGVNDPLYIRRDQDAVAEAAAARIGGETLLIRGPRQWGKSSLAVRYRDACVRHGKAWAYIDFQLLTDDDLSSYSFLITAITNKIAEDLDLDLPTAVGSPVTDLTRFMQRMVLPQVPGGVVIVFDEADRIISRPYKRNFFAMLRAWHNLRATRPNPWERCDLAVVIATEPWLLIDDPRESPFNVATPLELAPLSVVQTAELGERQNMPLDSAEADQLWRLLGGQPYLSRLAFYRMQTNRGLTLARLDDTAADASGGPFADHLKSVLSKLKHRPELNLLAAMVQVERHGSVPNEESFHRLSAAGLVIRDRSRIVPANLLYARFIRDVV